MRRLEPAKRYQKGVPFLRAVPRMRVYVRGVRRSWCERAITQGLSTRCGSEIVARECAPAVAASATSPAVVHRLHWSRAEIIEMKWQLRSSLRAIGAGAALVSALFAPVACSSTGEAGHSCSPPGFPSGGDACDQGLVCNGGEATPTCEEPNTHPVGDPCGADYNCKTGLWCDKEVCSEALGLGDPCPGGLGCGPGLQCIKAGAPICAAVDAGAADAGAE
jgi:hypothetical protein